MRNIVKEVQRTPYVSNAVKFSTSFGVFRGGLLQKIFRNAAMLASFPATFEAL